MMFSASTMRHISTTGRSPAPAGSRRVSSASTWPLSEGWGEAELEARLYPDIEWPIRFNEPDFPAMHQEPKRKEVTLQLLWFEYAAVHGPQAYSYSHYCHHNHRLQARQKRSMHQLHKVGEKLFIDYCGPTFSVVDRHTGELRQAQVFVTVLRPPATPRQLLLRRSSSPASMQSYTEAIWSQQLPDWITSHQWASRFFGGTTELLILLRIS